MKAQMFGALVGLCVINACGPQSNVEPADGSAQQPTAGSASVRSGAGGAASASQDAGAPSTGSGGSSALATTGSLGSLQVTEVASAQLSAVTDTNAAFRLLVTDAPIAAQAVNVEFCGMSVHHRDVEGDDAGVPPDDGWVQITAATDCKSFDLLQLQNGLTTELGLNALPPGTYGQVRLNLKSATIQVGGQVYPLTIPSGVLKIGHEFTVEAGRLVTLAVDFNAALSIHDSGHGYVMSPVIAIAGELHEHVQDVRARARKHEDDERAAEARHAAGGAGGAGGAGESDAEDNHGGAGGAGGAGESDVEDSHGAAGHEAPTTTMSTQADGAGGAGGSGGVHIVTTEGISASTGGRGGTNAERGGAGGS